MDTQRTTQLENGTCRLFPLPSLAPAHGTPAQLQGSGCFHPSSVGHYHFPTALDAKQPAASSFEARECQCWVTDLALRWGIASMGQWCPGLMF